MMLWAICATMAWNERSLVGGRGSDSSATMLLKTQELKNSRTQNEEDLVKTGVGE